MTIDIDSLLSRLDIAVLSSILTTIVNGGYWKGMKAGSEEVTGVTFEPQDKFTIAALQDRVIELSTSTRDRIIGDLKQSLMDGVANRESIFELTERISESFEGMQRWQIERVARTEVLTAVNMGRNDAWIQNGVPYKVWWNAAINNKRTADDSKRMYGQIVKVDESFRDPMTGIQYMMPPMRPNDRCTARPLRALPEDVTIIGGMMYHSRMIRKEARVYKFALVDILKGGIGSGIKGHVTNHLEYVKSLKKMSFDELKKENKKVLIDYNLVGGFESWVIDEGQTGLGGATIDGIIAEAFNLDKSKTRESSKEFQSERWYTNKDYEGIKKVYAITQEVLKRDFPNGKITLHRAVDKTSRDLNVKSWTDDIKIANKFASGDIKNKESKGKVLSKEIPIRNVLSFFAINHILEMGNENEFMVFER